MTGQRLEARFWLETGTKVPLVMWTDGQVVDDDLRLCDNTIDGAKGDCRLGVATSAVRRDLRVIERCLYEVW